MSRPVSSLRCVLAVCLLAVVAVFEVRALQWPDVIRRLGLVRRQIGDEHIPRSSTTGFYFDPSYSDFLDEVARRTPSNATVAVIAPPRPDLYRYQAVYTLAPRRVVETSQIPEAAYVAVYGRRWKPGAAGQPLPNGTLLPR